MIGIDGRRCLEMDELGSETWPGKEVAILNCCNERRLGGITSCSMEIGGQFGFRFVVTKDDIEGCHWGGTRVALIAMMKGSRPRGHRFDYVGGL